MKKLILLQIVALMSALPILAGEDVYETMPVLPDASVEISNILGSVTIIGWAEDRVEVEGTLGENTGGLEFSGDKREVEVRVKYPKKVKQFGQSHITVRVPAGCEVEAETVSANIDASDLTGSAELQSVSGNITVTGNLESVEAESVSGEILLENVQRAEAQTVSGSIHVMSGQLKKGDFQAVSGNVVFEDNIDPKGRLDIESFSGTVKVHLPASVSARFDVTTFSGDIVNKLSSDPIEKNEVGPGKSLAFTTGSGDARISVESFSGSVKLLQK
jgi:DUF4097 and DUF4098 domain-containing protein YvlB